MIRPRHVGDAHASVRRPIHVSTLDGVPRWGDTGRRGAYTQLCKSLLQALVFDLQLQEGVEHGDVPTWKWLCNGEETARSRFVVDIKWIPLELE